MAWDILKQPVLNRFCAKNSRFKHPNISEKSLHNLDHLRESFLEALWILLFGPPSWLMSNMLQDILRLYYENTLEYQISCWTHTLLVLCEWQPNTDGQSDFNLEVSGQKHLPLAQDGARHVREIFSENWWFSGRSSSWVTQSWLDGKSQFFIVAPTDFNKGCLNAKISSWNAPWCSQQIKTIAQVGTFRYCIFELEMWLNSGGSSTDWFLNRRSLMSCFRFST